MYKRLEIGLKLVRKLSPSPYWASLALNMARPGVMDGHRLLRAESLAAEAADALAIIHVCKQYESPAIIAGLSLEDWSQPIAPDGRSPARPGETARQRRLHRRDHPAEATKRRQP